MTFSTYEQIKQKLFMQPQTWLITGVAGFIGSHLLATLLKLNQKVIGIDNFVTGHKRNLEAVLASVTPKQQSQFQFFEFDICDLDKCRQVMVGINLVLHQAALGSVPRSIQCPDVTHAVNASGFLNVLTAAKEAKVKRFVYASSSSVYGDSIDLPKKEEHIGKPLSPYAVTKYTNELYAKVFADCYGLETMGLRYFNVFGPRQDPAGPYAAVIPRWIQALLNNEPVSIYGDGETTRDFCYVDNAVQANLLAAVTETPAALNQVYNIAVGEQNSLKVLYEMLVEILGLSAANNVRFCDFRAGDIRQSLADITKAKALLGYDPQYKLKDGLRMIMETDAFKSKGEGLCWNNS